VIFAAIPSERQQFPLADDWVYAEGLFRLWRGEGLHYFTSAVPVLGQWLWSLPFVAILGPSHAVLRLSTVCLGLAGTCAFYALLRQAGAAAARAGLGAVTLALNPFFVLLEGSYMSEVPALSFGLIGLALYGRGLKGGSAATWVGGALFAILAVTTRQNMIAVPAAAALLVLLQRPRRWGLGALATALPIIIGLATSVWFWARPDVFHPKMIHFAPDHSFLILFATLHYGGLAALPLVAFDPRPRAPKAFIIGLLAMSASAYYWWRRGPELPRFGDLAGFFPYCTGVIGYSGPYTGIMAGHMKAFLPAEIRIGLTIVGCLGGAWLIARAAYNLRGLLASPLVVFGLLELPLLILVEGVYDRYLFLLFPTVLFLGFPFSLPVRAGPSTPLFPEARWRWASAAVMLAVMGFVSVGLMHDCLSWNEARWKLGRRAPYKPWEIDGGFEWNGTFHLMEAPGTNRAPFPGSLTGPLTRKRFPGVTGRAALAFWPLPDTFVIDKEPFVRWLPPGQEYIHLISRDPEPRGDEF
jgi:hypothetical protein